MRYLLDTNILVFYAQGGEKLDKDTTEIFRDYENLIYVSSEVIKEIMHLVRYKKIDVKQWRTPNDIWKFIEEWEFKRLRPRFQQHARKEEEKKDNNSARRLKKLFGNSGHTHTLPFRW